MNSISKVSNVGPPPDLEFIPCPDHPDEPPSLLKRIEKGHIQVWCEYCETLIEEYDICGRVGCDEKAWDLQRLGDWGQVEACCRRHYESNAAGEILPASWVSPVKEDVITHGDRTVRRQCVTHQMFWFGFRSMDDECPRCEHDREEKLRAELECGQCEHMILMGESPCCNLGSEKVTYLINRPAVKLCDLFEQRCE